MSEIDTEDREPSQVQAAEHSQTTGDIVGLGQPFNAGLLSLRNSGISLGRNGLIVRASQHLYLQLSLQFLGWIVALCAGAGVEGVLRLFR
ncbi:hypothetical protein [Streptomyces sp. HUAS ZL42]|uniref:hypothetical protein n=1 Tax=Streptomyces sp. HUAS ZL42 TaxID=3231715 RepID=UPI00345F02F0